MSILGLCLYTGVIGHFWPNSDCV